MKIRIAAVVAAIALGLTGYGFSIVGDGVTVHHSTHVTASIVGDGHHTAPNSIVGD